MKSHLSVGKPGPGAKPVVGASRLAGNGTAQRTKNLPGPLPALGQMKKHTGPSIYRRGG